MARFNGVFFLAISGGNSGAHFTNQFSILIHNRWKRCFSLIRIVIKLSVYFANRNKFCYVSWYMDFILKISAPKLIQIQCQSISFHISYNTFVVLITLMGHKHMKNWKLCASSFNYYTSFPNRKRTHQLLVPYVYIYIYIYIYADNLRCRVYISYRGGSAGICRCQKSLLITEPS